MDLILTVCLFRSLTICWPEVVPLAGDVDCWAAAPRHVVERSDRDAGKIWVAGFRCEKTPRVSPQG